MCSSLFLSAMKMNKLFTLIIIGSLTSSASAQEGMWIPSLLETNEDEMHAMGFQLDAEDVYSINEGSMKDAVLIFGGGCTGEVISDKGLVLTNHHCGFDAVNQLSSVDHNYLRDGYWAENMAGELPGPGLKVTFIVRMEDVTSSILKGLDPSANNAVIIQQRSDSILVAATKDSHYGGYVRPFYYGNQYFLFVTEEFTDIRLVGVPPRSVGEFGGETDNWIWPRHTGDFSIWRIYAGPDNKPAAYSPDNKPFVPRYHFPVSLAGAKEGDFTMVFGFPGRTQEYLPAAAVELIMNEQNPNRVALRELRIRTAESFMHGNDTITLMYASKVKSLANAYKKWQGETLGLTANNAIDKKLEFEYRFDDWCSTPAGKPYAGVTDELDSLYRALNAYTGFLDHTIEGALGVEAIRFARSFRGLATRLNEVEPDKDRIAQAIDDMRNTAASHFSNYYHPIDEAVFPLLMKRVYEQVDTALLPDYFLEQIVRYKGDFVTWAESLWNSSALVSLEGTNNLLDRIAKGEKDALANDPVYMLYDAFLQQYLLTNNHSVQPLQEAIDRKMQLYMAGIMASGLKDRLYPDANSTLRVAYGQVNGYTPRNGVYYKPYTTHEGILEKYKDGDEEFDVPDQLLALLQGNDFGRYADANGDLPVAFLASNHTTGGNSGSPVLNANGELIGTNFDRVWEGTMSDIMYDFDRCRNISVDIRYTMFITEYLGGARWVIDEILQTK